MKHLTLLIILVLCISSAIAQSIYIKTFGNKSDIPVIFVHGGPGGNSVQFEATTAQKLADEGFYVIVYDRRGEGRSADEGAQLTYQEAFDDLNGILKKYKLKNANLIGFSFGGLVTTLYAEKYPQNVKAIVLVSSLISQQESYDYIFESVTKIYTEKGNSGKLKEISDVKKLNKNSYQYRGECFALASENGFFTVANPDQEAENIYKAFEASPLYKDNIRNKKAPEAFYRNEKRTNIDIKAVLERLKKKNIRIYALYGKQDGLFSTAQVNNVKVLTGEKNFKYLNKCSHYLYADQQNAFLNSIKNWLK